MSELLKINVNEHTEKKNGLSYLSWAWAWAEVLKIDPRATWTVAASGPTETRVPFIPFPDGSAMVNVSVTIKADMKSCFLPVMNHRNQAIKNPDAFAVNTAIMRCLAKAIAMHGLGLYIYAGEDLPESDKPEPPSGVDPNTDEVIGYTPRFSARKPDHQGVAAMVTQSEAAELSPETMAYLSELAEEIKANFPKSGPKTAYERIELEKLEVGELLYLSMQLPVPMRNAIKAASTAARRVGMPA